MEMTLRRMEVQPIAATDVFLGFQKFGPLYPDTKSNTAQLTAVTRQIASEALACAIEELEETFQLEHPRDGKESGPTLDGAIAYLKAHSQPE